MRVNASSNGMRKRIWPQAHYLTVPLSSRRAAGVLGHDFKKMGLQRDQIDHVTYGNCSHPQPQTFHAVRTLSYTPPYTHGAYSNLAVDVSVRAPKMLPHPRTQTFHAVIPRALQTSHLARSAHAQGLHNGNICLGGGRRTGWMQTVSADVQL